jgi:hypothetical protein
MGDVPGTPVDRLGEQEGIETGHRLPATLTRATSPVYACDWTSGLRPFNPEGFLLQMEGVRVYVPPDHLFGNPDAEALKTPQEPAG